MSNKKFVEASTPKFGEWAERWDSREPLTGAKYHNSYSFYCTGFARIPALFGPLSKFGGGRLYKLLLHWLLNFTGKSLKILASHILRAGIFPITEKSL